MIDRGHVFDAVRDAFPDSTVFEDFVYDRDVRRFVIYPKDPRDPDLRGVLEMSGLEARQCTGPNEFAEIMKHKIKVLVSTLQNELAKSDPLTDILKAVAEARQKEDRDQDKFLALMKSRIDHAEKTLIQHHTVLWDS